MNMDFKKIRGSLLFIRILMSVLIFVFVLVSIVCLQTGFMDYSSYISWSGEPQSYYAYFSIMGISVLKIVLCAVVLFLISPLAYRLLLFTIAGEFIFYFASPWGYSIGVHVPSMLALGVLIYGVRHISFLSEDVDLKDYKEKLKFYDKDEKTSKKPIPQTDEDLLTAAKRDIKWAYIVGIIITIPVFVITMLSWDFRDISSWSSLIVLCIYCGLSFGIYKKSRVCSILLFSLYFFDRIAALILFGGFEIIYQNARLIFWQIIIASLLGAGIHGTFVYHKLVDKGGIQK